MKVYIAGPMRGYENYNFDAFDNAKKYLESKDIIAISPADLDRVYEGWGKYAPDDFTVDKRFKYDCIKRDLDVIFQCDGIYMLHGWEPSTGANLELSLANFLGIKVYYESEGV
jgi:hypothetical protein